MFSLSTYTYMTHRDFLMVFQTIIGVSLILMGFNLWSMDPKHPIKRRLRKIAYLASPRHWSFVRIGWLVATIAVSSLILCFA